MENRTGQILELETGQRFLILRQAMYKQKVYYVADIVASSTDGNPENDTLSEEFTILEEIEADGKKSYKRLLDPEIILKILEK